MAKSIHRPESAVLRRRLREIRVAAGLTQAEVSSQLGRDQTYMSNIERGVRRLDVIELRDICRLSGKDFLEFLAELERELAARTRRRI